MKRVVVIVSSQENLQMIKLQQELKPSFSSLNYDEVFYMETHGDNVSSAKMSLLCPTAAYNNLTEKMVNVWNSEALQWFKQHQRHYKKMYWFA